MCTTTSLVIQMNLFLQFKKISCQDFHNIIIVLDNDEISTLKNAMKQLEEATCIRFRKALDDDDDFISIVKDDDDQCSSRIGRRGGEQVRVQIEFNLDYIS